jgi:hypothetical protein
MLVLSLSCSGEPKLEITAEQTEETPPRWPRTQLDHEHVLIGPGSSIHAVEGFAEVARLPDDAGFLDLRVVDHRDGWIIVNPSPTHQQLRSVELEFAVPEASLHPAAKQTIRRQYDDGTELEIAAGAPLRPVGPHQYELIVDGVGLILNFDEDPTTLHYRPGPARRARKPDLRVLWDWSEPTELWVGPRQPPSSSSTDLHDCWDSSDTPHGSWRGFHRAFHYPILPPSLPPLRPVSTSTSTPARRYIGRAARLQVECDMRSRCRRPSGRVRRPGCVVSCSCRSNCAFCPRRSFAFRQLCSTVGGGQASPRARLDSR